MKLHAITNGFAVFTSSDGKIISEPITQGAKDVLAWYYHNIPANQY